LNFDFLQELPDHARVSLRPRRSQAHATTCPLNRSNARLVASRLLRFAGRLL
jgi:hypothetical protein